MTAAAPLGFSSAARHWLRRCLPGSLGARLLRGVLYGVLALAALFYILPLVVMLMTSIKPLSEIRRVSQRRGQADNARGLGRLLLIF